MDAARSLLRSVPSQSNVPASKTAMWASPNGARVRSHPSNLRVGVTASPSFALSRREGAMPLRTAVQRVVQPMEQSRTTQTAQTESKAGETKAQKLLPVPGIHLGDFGDVGTMTAETVDFLIRVLEDRKQELLVTHEDKDVRVIASWGNEEMRLEGPASTVARFQLNSAGDGGTNVTELVRSHSYEALVQLEKILEARHNKLMSDGSRETST